ncbi:MAG: prepilin peptidase [Acidobacteria bacterium]|nr:prepilin peptidase [Acidobacteriota bacterium]
MSILTISVAVVAAVACAIDLKERRIPNWLTFGAAFAGLVYQFATHGFMGLLSGGAGLLVGIAVFFLPFALGGLGAGDVKLVAALGAWLGPYEIVWLALYAAVAGAVLALALSLARGYLRQAVTNIWLLLMHWRIQGLKPLPELTIHQGRGPKLAYAVAIFAGTMVTIWIR